MRSGSRTQTIHGDCKEKTRPILWVLTELHKYTLFVMILFPLHRFTMRAYGKC